MKREELQHDFHNEQGINWLNSQGEPDIDYVMWLENKILAIKNNTPLPPAEDAEKLKQALCDDIRESLNRAYLDKIFDSEQNSLPLVDYLSAAIPGNTIASGKEEIENIVEQIYFDMEEWKSLALFQPQPTAEGAEEILEGVMVENGFTYVSFPAFVENESSIDVFDIACKAMTEFATLHAQQMADKMKEANQFILDIAKIFGIETDGVGYDGLQLSIDDFKEVADKMVEDRLRDELIAYDKFLSNTYWGVGHIVKRDEAVDEYLKQRQP